MPPSVICYLRANGLFLGHYASQGSLLLVSLLWLGVLVVVRLVSGSSHPPIIGKEEERQEGGRGRRGEWKERGRGRSGEEGESGEGGGRLSVSPVPKKIPLGLFLAVACPPNFSSSFPLGLLPPQPVHLVVCCLSQESGRSASWFYPQHDFRSLSVLTS